MKLSLDMIFHQLNQNSPVMMCGQHTRALFSEPVLYTDADQPMRTGKQYIALAQQLPYRPVIEKDVLLICIGDNARLAYYKEHATVLQLQQDADLFHTYNCVLQLYHHYSDWESDILALLSAGSDIQAVLQRTYQLVSCPIGILNHALQFVASVAMTELVTTSQRDNVSGEHLNLELFLSYLKQAEPQENRQGAFVLQVETGPMLCINLTDGQDNCLGYMFFDLSSRGLLPGDELLAELLAGLVSRFAVLSPKLLQSHNGVLRDILQLLLRGMPLDQTQKLQLGAYSGPYVVISIHYLKRFSVLPLDYICASLEALLPNSILFEHGGSILGMIPLRRAGQAPLSEESLADLLQPYIRRLRLCVGMSQQFDDPQTLYNYYLEAEAAIENGQLFRPGQELYLFRRYALYELVANALGNLPAEAYFPKGLQALRRHDVEKGTAYLETLTVFLEENLSYVNTARRLYVHRSTLTDRMARILKILDTDLTDPDQRLLLHLLLKALQIEQQAKSY